MGKEYWRGFKDGRQHAKESKEAGILHDLSDALAGTNYNPPSDPEKKAEYDAGYEDGLEED